MDPNVVEKVESAINVVAEKIGAGADYFWPMLVKAEVIGGLGHLIGLVGLLVISLVVFRYGIKGLPEDSPYSYTDKQCVRMIMSIVGGISSAICCIVLATTASSALTRVFAPEATALKRIFELV